MSKAENIKDAKALCPAMVGKPGQTKKRCDQDHRPEASKMGDSKGSSSTLAVNLGGADNHPDYDGLRTLAAHHIVSCQIFYAKKNSSADNQFWEDVCHAYGYDINCKENGIFLPSKMYLACVLKKPLHRGNHDTTEVFDGDILIPNLTYTIEVQKLIKPIRRQVSKGFFCNDPEKFIQAMNNASSSIQTEILSFLWTLTYDGRDYMPGGIGCCNFRSITTKLLHETISKLRGKKINDVNEQIEDLHKCNREHDFQHNKEIL